MNPYEVMFIVSPTVEGEEAIDASIERFGRLIVDNGGAVTGVDKWGKKRLAYEIKGHTEGHYVVMSFKADNSIVNELNRIMKLTDEIVRHMVVRLEEQEAAVEETDDEAAEVGAEETAEEATAGTDENRAADAETAAK